MCFLKLVKRKRLLLKILVLKVFYGFCKLPVIFGWHGNITFNQICFGVGDGDKEEILLIN
jgi:hypothetical protein